MLQKYQFPINIYYEDTDAGGYVYHASYLRFAERARGEILRAQGLSQWDLYKKEGMLFVVKSCSLDYKAPAFLDDALMVHTHLQEMQRASITFKQYITRNDHILVAIEIVLVCVEGSGKPVRIPLKIKEALMPSNLTKEL